LVVPVELAGGVDGTAGVDDEPPLSDELPLSEEPLDELPSPEPEPAVGVDDEGPPAREPWSFL
jgi:hypothetical protein